MVCYPLYLFGRLPDAEIDYRVLLQHKEKSAGILSLLIPLVQALALPLRQE